MYSESDGEREHELSSRSSTGSEVVMMNERAVASALCTAVPTVSNLNVTKTNGLHIGPKFVSVTQNVHNNEVVKGRFLGLELVSSKKTRKFRCSVAVFVCWALVVASGLAFYIFHFALQQDRLDIDIHEEWYLRRGDWQAMPPYNVEYLSLPLSYVLIGHSGSNYCDQKVDCIKIVLSIQADHLRRGWDDIGPNFLISGDGLVFEGRGTNVIGAMVRSWNSKSITVMFLGDYRTSCTNEVQFNHLNILLEKLVEAGILQPNYTISGHCQVTTDIISPGPNIMESLKNYTHWNPKNKNKCLK